MRLAPVAMFFAGRAAEGIAACGESSRTTHAAVEAVDACRYFGGLLIGAMQGAPKDELLSPLYTPVPGEWERRPLAPKVADVASGSFARKAPLEIRGSGYVVQSLEAALWAYSTTNDFREGCLAAVNLGDDADTTAAVYGQIAGAVYGEKAIPEQWVAKLAKGDLIADLARRLQTTGD
jgi:ADP-ribosylglycohydrolase